MSDIRTAAVAAVLGLMPFAALAQSDATPADPLEAVPCPVASPWDGEEKGQTYDCSVVIVPENHAEPGRTLELTVLRLKTTTLSPMPDPMVYLSGGPGGSALNEITGNAMLFKNMQDIRARRDVIFFDQRGTGYSQILACGPFNAAIGVVGELFPQVSIADLEAANEKASTVLLLAVCAAGHASEGIDLAQYNSVASAHDIAAIVAALGYGDAYNLYGTSYGTRLALNAMRSTPDNIRAVVLDGTAPPDTANNAYTATKVQEHYDTIFRACAAHPACGERFPDLRNRFVAVLNDIGTDPVTFDPPLVPNKFLRIRFAVIDRIDPAFFARFGKFNNDAGRGGYAAFLPWIIEALESRDTDALRHVFGEEPAEPEVKVTPTASADDVFEADDVFLAPAIDLVLALATQSEPEGDPTLSGDFVALVLRDLTQRLRAGESQARVVRDLVDFGILPLKGTDRDALSDYAAAHLSPSSATTAHALIAAMSRQEVRDTMWAIQDVGTHMAGMGERDGAPGIAVGLMYAVNCPEDISLTPEQAVIDLIEATPYPGVIVQDLESYRQSRTACTFFPTPFTREEMMSPVVSDIPSLIFQEELDTQTPLSLGRKTLETLENGFLLEWLSEGHVIAARSADGCAGAIAAAFLDRPAVQPDFTCASAPYYTLNWKKAFETVEGGTAE